MKKTIVWKNYKGETVTFTSSPPFLLGICSGFHEVAGKVNSVSSAYGVGTTWQGTSQDERDLTIKGTIAQDILNNRELLLNRFPLHTVGTLYYYEGDIKRKIKCYPEKVSVPEKKGYTKDFTISLVATNPRFSAIGATVLSMSTWDAAFEFPLEIDSADGGTIFGEKFDTTMGTTENDTSIEYGMTITFKANDVVVNPYLFNVNTREIMQVEKTMSLGDQIIITTHIDNKNIIYISIEDGIEQNVNFLKTYESVYLQVPIGTNTFRSGADSGEENLETTIEFLPEYEAV